MTGGHLEADSLPTGLESDHVVWADTWLLRKKKFLTELKSVLKQLLSPFLFPRVHVVSLIDLICVAAKSEDMIQSETLKSFTCFSKLPLELRQQIWVAAQPNRIIKVDASYECFEPISISFHSREPSLSLLSVNREARQETLRSYELVHEHKDSEVNPRFYFNSALDTIYFEKVECSWYHVVNAIDQSIHIPTRRVKRVAVEDGPVIPYSSPLHLFYQSPDLEVTCAVKELCLVSTFIGGGHWNFLFRTGEESDFDRSDVGGQVVRGLRKAKGYFQDGTAPVVRSVPRSIRDKGLTLGDLGIS